MKFNTRATIIKEVLVSTIINGLIPYVIYKLLLTKVSSFDALLISVSVPLIYNAYQIIRNKKTDVYGMFALSGFVLSVIAMFISSDERLLLVRESFVTGILGLVFFCSLAFKRPLIFHFAIKFTSSGSEADKKRFEAQWNASPKYRFVIRLMSIIWGGTLVLEALTKVILIYSLPISTFLIVSTPVSYGFIGFAVFCTVLMAKQSKQRASQILEKHQN